MEQMVSVPPQAWESGNLINGFSFRVHLITFLSTSNFPKVRDVQINFGINSLVWKLNYPTLHLFQLLFPSLPLAALFISAAVLWKMNLLAFRLTMLCGLQASSLTSLCCSIIPHKPFRLPSMELPPQQWWGLHVPPSPFLLHGQAVRVAFGGAEPRTADTTVGEEKLTFFKGPFLVPASFLCTCLCLSVAAHTPPDATTCSTHHRTGPG